MTERGYVASNKNRSRVVGVKRSGQATLVRQGIYRLGGVSEYYHDEGGGEMLSQTFTITPYELVH